MKNIISKIPKEKIQAVTLAEQKVSKLQDKHYGYMDAGAAIGRQLEALEAEIRGVIADAGDPAPLYKKAADLRSQAFDFQNIATLSEDAIAAAQDVLNAARKELEASFRQAMQEERVKREEQAQQAADVIDGIYKKWRDDLFAAAQQMNVEPPITFPRLSIKGDFLRW